MKSVNYFYLVMKDAELVILIVCDLYFNKYDTQNNLSTFCDTQT